MREEGYYFVKITDKWLIGYYFPDDNIWGLMGGSELKTKNFKEIGDKIELPKD